MPRDFKTTTDSKIKAWIRKRFSDITLLLVVASMILWIVCLAVSDRPDKPSWLLVPLTVIYAVFTLWMAAAAFQNAAAARRSAEAMEASVEEQRQSRWAAFAAILSFPEGSNYRVNADGSTSIVLGNPYRQPMLRLWVRMWEMEGHNMGEGQIKYSTMKESSPIDVEANAASVTVQVHPTSQLESERVRIANLALERFRQVYGGAVPMSALCLITYSHRAQIGEAILVFDLNRVEVQA